jgi:TRAP-type transport system periplasmic protein
MRIRKSVLTSASVVFMATALAACSGGDGDADASGDGGDAGAAESVVFQAGYENNPGEPIDDAMNRWAELLEEQSDGTMTMELFPSSQLGSKTDLIDQMRAGSPIITLADGAFYADQGVPDFGITFAPFLFESWDEAFALTESDWYAEQSAALEEQGLKIITSNWIYGDRHLLVNGDFSGIEDLEGQKIRVPNNIIQIKGMEALGATPTPMALGDVYTSLQQGTIDGLENPVPVLQNGKFQEVAKTLVLTGHVKNFTTWLTGADTFSSLTDEQQQILQATGEEAGLFNNELQEEAFEASLQALEDEGVTVVEPDLAEFRERAETFYEMPEIEELFSEGLYDTVKEAMQQ